MRYTSWLRVRLAKPVSLAAAVMVSLAAASPAYAWEWVVCAAPSNLPHSRLDETGFENRIAKVLAEAMGATVSFQWFPQGQQMMDDVLRVGRCDAVMGVPDGEAGLVTTYSYYRSPFVFVQRPNEGYNINNFDDPALRTLKIGIQPSLGPTHQALLSRGLRDQIVREFNELAWVYDPAVTDPLAPIVAAVANGEIDVGITWGPAAAYYAAMQNPPLVVLPVDPPFEPPFIPMFINMAIGVRIGDESLRDRLDIAIAQRWEEIYQILAEYHVPVMELARPTLTIGGP